MQELTYEESLDKCKKLLTEHFYKLSKEEIIGFIRDTVVQKLLSDLSKEDLIKIVQHYQDMASAVESAINKLNAMNQELYTWDQENLKKIVDECREALYKEPAPLV